VTALRTLVTLLGLSLWAVAATAGVPAAAPATSAHGTPQRYEFDLTTALRYVDREHSASIYLG
jgi:hypothetical protein